MVSLHLQVEVHLKIRSSVMIENQNTNFMRNLFLTILASLSLILWGSCSVSEIEKIPTPENEMDFPDFFLGGDDTSGDDAQTKVYFYNNSFRWKSGDLAYIFPGTSFRAVYSFIGLDGATSGTLKKSASEGDFSINSAKLTKNYAFVPTSVNPYLRATSPLPTMFGMTLQEASDYDVLNGIGNNATPMMAITSDASDNNLYFRSMCGFLCLKLKGTASIKTIHLFTPSGELLCGSAEVTDDDGMPSLTVASGKNHLSLNCVNTAFPSGVSISSDNYTYFYFCVPPGDYSSFKFIIQDTSGEMMIYNYDEQEDIEVVRNFGYYLSSDYVPQTVSYINIPDAAFKSYLVSNFDTDYDGEISYTEAEAVTSMTLNSYLGISSLEGIQFFTNLKTFISYSNNYTTLDLSDNHNLQKVDIRDNYLYLKSLNLGYNENITVLSLYRLYALPSLDVSGLPNLKHFTCNVILFSVFDISYNTDLEFFFYDVGYNYLTSIYFADKYPKMLQLQVNACYKFSNIDLSPFPILTYLSLSFDNISEIDVSDSPNLQFLHCYYSKVDKLILGNNPTLYNIYCNNNNIKTLNLKNLWSLQTLICSYNQLSVLDLSSCTNIVELQCVNNSLSSIDTYYNKELTYLLCGGNNIRTLNLSNNKNLVYVDASNSVSLKSVNFDNCTMLDYILLSNCNLKTIDITPCSKSFSYIGATSNPLAHLYISSDQTLDSYDLDDPGVIEVR